MTPEEFNAIFRAKLPEITRFLARRLDHSYVEDIASDLFELAWSKKDSIPAGLELPWLYKSANYLVANFNRKQAGRNRLFSIFERPATAPSAESIALADLELSEAWGRLKVAERELITLWSLDGLNNAQIAAVIGTNENTAAIRLTRAKANLKNLLAESENFNDSETSK